MLAQIVQSVFQKSEKVVTENKSQRGVIGLIHVNKTIFVKLIEDKVIWDEINVKIEVKREVELNDSVKVKIKYIQCKNKFDWLTSDVKCVWLILIQK